jgi:hypothetical protein
MGEATSPKPAATPLRYHCFLLILTVAAVFLHSYHPCVEDAEIYVPAIKKALDPSLYPHDAYLFTGQTRFSLFPIVTASLVRFSHLPLDWVLLLLHALSIYLLLLGAWRISRQCFPRESASWCGVALLACLLTLPVAGTALYIVDEYLTPRALAAFAVLWALAGYLERKPARTVGWLAFSFIFHPLMAALGTCYLVVLLAQNATIRWRRSTAVTAFAALALPLTPNAYHEAVGTRSYLFLTRWEWYEWLGAIGPLLLLGWFCRIARRKNLTVLARLNKALLIFGALFLLAGLPISLVPRLFFLAEFQPLRSLHLVYILLILFGGGLLAEFALQRGTKRWLSLFLFLPLCMGMFCAQQALFPATPHVEWPAGTTKNPWVESFLWIRENTPRDGWFALDPRYMALPGEDEHGFRAIAERSRMADWIKDPGAVTIAPNLAEEWWRQVQALAGWPSFQPTDFERLRRDFGVNWVVVATAQRIGLTCPYQNSELAVCRLE